MIVCHCFVVNDRQVKAAVAAGAKTVDDVTEMTNAGGVCGGCHPAICKTLRTHPSGACGGDACANTLGVATPDPVRSHELVEAQ